MRILVFADNHFCEHASIIRKYGTTFSARLENQIKSMNWAESLAAEKNIDIYVGLGDFFDKPELNECEITALNNIQWNNKPHFFIVGNHESSRSNLKYSSAEILKDEENSHFVISDYTTLSDSEADVELCVLPYITEVERKTIPDYFGPKDPAKKRIIFSHNDIKGIQMGPVISRTGFELEDLQQNCDLCFNGHLHNGQPVAKNIVNLGNLTGKDFGEDASKYLHNIAIIDTNTGKVEFIENPHAFNFYKLDIFTKEDINRLKALKDNSVVSLKCKEQFVKEVREIIETLPNIIEHRIIIDRDYTVGELADTALDISTLTVDHLGKFIECCKEKIENSEILSLELAEVCK